MTPTGAFRVSFVALAHDLKVKLYTQDKELLEKFPETAVKWFVRDEC